MSDGKIFKTIKPIYKDIKASKRNTKKRIAKSLSHFELQSKSPNPLLAKKIKNG